MKRQFDHTAEQELREAFIAARGGTCGYVDTVRSHILCSCRVFRDLFPGDSILNHTETTGWVPAWNARQHEMSFSTRQTRLWALDTWWQWLFERHIIDDNVLKLVTISYLARNGTPRLTLRCNLQRCIAEYLESRSDLAAKTRSRYGIWLSQFNRFINQSPELLADAGAGLPLGEEVLGAWFRGLCAKRPREAVSHAAARLNTFLDFLVSKGALAENVLRRLCEAYPTGKRVAVAYALAADDQGTALRALARPPLFRSYLADRMHGFLDFKRAAGCREWYGLSILRELDQFLAAQDNKEPITNALLARWWASRRANRARRWVVTRQFCLYLRRYNPATCEPDPLLGRRPPSQFKPRIIQPVEMRALLAAIANVVPGCRSALRPCTYRTLLMLLYCTGMRISEALGLQVGDVDLRERVITIRETKFYKSRLVPFSGGLSKLLRDYQRERLRLTGAPARGAPFFPNIGGGHLSLCSVEGVWQKLIRSAALRVGAAHGPRLHDLRHSFATLRLATWYREGADVEAMLPRLATYLGHVEVASTYRYLTVLPQTLLAASERFRSYGGSLIAAGGGNHALN
jgi:integrase/recombinase XerD